MHTRNARLIIRRARTPDAPLIISAHIRSIREVCSADYTIPQIEAWAGRDFKASRWEETIERDLVWVIADSIDNIFGFGHLMIFGSDEGFFPEDKQSGAYIAGLYLVPEALRKGLATKIVRLMLEECIREGILQITLEATKTALPFYEKLEFRALRESSVLMSGVAVECVEMARVVNLLTI